MSHLTAVWVELFYHGVPLDHKLMTSLVLEGAERYRATNECVDSVE